MELFLFDDYMVVFPGRKMKDTKGAKPLFPGWDTDCPVFLLKEHGKFDPVVDPCLVVDIGDIVLYSTL